MSRLVYPKSPRPGMQQIPPQDGYLDRVAKYVPSEIVACYLFCQSLALSSTFSGQGKRILLIIVILVLLAATPTYIWWLAVKSGPGQPWVEQAAISSVAFLVWVFALGQASQTIFGLSADPVGGILLALFTAVAGLFQPK